MTAGHRKPSAMRRGVVAVLLTLLASLGATYASAVRGYAAGMAVAAGRISTFRPGQLPDSCTGATVVADADTWVDQASRNTNYGSDLALTINGQGSGSARALLRFPLPPAASCTLAIATLRVFNAAPTPGRTIAAYAAAGTWSESATTYSTMPATTGAAVDAQATTGWMQWTVTSHVESMYSSDNHGFVLRDAAENGPTAHTQQFDSRETGNKPQLVLQWQ
ncbi:MAG: DNRLRE domain-containing protein [Nitriliruptorales bacterium]|nr:DNRLRE domain-containing protein [Nitriliruptorales bacterium]